MVSHAPSSVRSASRPHLGGALEDLCRGRPECDELFAALLRQVTGDDRLDVIVIEDIHWADEATLDLMRFLTRRIRAASVLVTATYRDDRLAPSSPLRLALGDLAARRWTRRLDLPPLSVFLRASRTAVLEHRGHWDEAVAIGAQLLEKSSAAPLNQIWMGAGRGSRSGCKHRGLRGM